MDAALSHISPAMRSAVGGEVTRRVSYPISVSDIRRWALAVYYPDLPPWSVADGDVEFAPEEFNPFAWAVADKTGRTDVDILDPAYNEKMLGIDGPALTFQLNGGLEVTYYARMKPGDVITSVERLADYNERPGRLGLMLFTIKEDTWTSHAGELIKIERSTLIRY